HRPPVHHHLRVRQRHGGARRRPRRRVPRARSAISAQIPGAVPDRGGGRRTRPRHRRVPCRADHRRARLRTQPIPAAGRYRVHLRTPHPALAVAPAGTVRRQVRMSAPSLPATEHPAALALARRSHTRWCEAVPWVLALAFYFAFPRYLGFGTDL